MGSVCSDLCRNNLPNLIMFSVTNKIFHLIDCSPKISVENAKKSTDSIWAHLLGLHILNLKSPPPPPVFDFPVILTAFVKVILLLVNPLNTFS